MAAVGGFPWTILNYKIKQTLPGVSRYCENEFSFLNLLKPSDCKFEDLAFFGISILSYFAFLLLHFWVDVSQNMCVFVAGLVVPEEATRKLMPSPPEPLSKDLFVYLCIYVLVFVYLYLCICGRPGCSRRSLEEIDTFP